MLSNLAKKLTGVNATSAPLSSTPCNAGCGCGYVNPNAYIACIENGQVVCRPC